MLFPFQCAVPEDHPMVPYLREAQVFSKAFPSDSSPVLSFPLFKMFFPCPFPFHCAVLAEDYPQPNKNNIPRAAVACGGACLVDGEHVALDTETSQQELSELRLGGAEGEDGHDVRGTDARELSEARRAVRGLTSLTQTQE